ncbi:MAG: hypothetical protein ACRBF0_19440 [Calditrichia bacterium]
MTMRNWVLFFSLAIPALHSCKPAGVVPPAIRVSVENRDDMLTITYVDKECIVDVYSSKGIGDADVDLEATAFLKSLILRMHLQGLEELVVSRGDQSYRIEVQSHGDRQIMQSYRAQASEEWESLSAADERNMVVRRIGSDGKTSTDVPLRNGYFEISLPSNLWKGKSRQKLSVSWIDFYR